VGSPQANLLVGLHQTGVALLSNIYYNASTLDIAAGLNNSSEHVVACTSHSLPRMVSTISLFPTYPTPDRHSRVEASQAKARQLLTAGPRIADAVLIH
jgi:hypothetical protein